jgi:hypothetical protein
VLAIALRTHESHAVEELLSSSTRES